MLINIALEKFFSIFVEKWIWKENEMKLYLNLLPVKFFNLTVTKMDWWIV